MKQELLAELKDLANKILRTERDSSISDLKKHAREVYEKLTVLAFAEENLNSLSSPEEFQSKKSEKTPNKEESEKRDTPSPREQPVIQMNEISRPQKITQPEQPKQATETKDEYLPDGTEYNADPITEPNTEKIKDIVAHMPPETQKLDHMINNIITKNGVDKFTEPPEQPKKDFRDIGVDYDNLPAFEPVKKNSKDERPRSLNDRLKKGINIGLNERLAFIRHLFDGKTADYNRVVSQLNTFDSVTEAHKFIQLVVKPDYKNWVGKEEFEKKFLELVDNKFKS
jgi:regulator of replication initiation timing